jgi:hypothetical protein
MTDRVSFFAIIVSIMTPSIMTLSTKTLSIITLIMTACNKIPLSPYTFSITYIEMMVSMKILSITKLCILTLNITIPGMTHIKG